MSLIRNYNILNSVHLDNMLLTKEEFEYKLTGGTRYVAAKFVLEDVENDLTAEICISEKSQIDEIRNAIKVLRNWISNGMNIVSGSIWGSQGGILKLQIDDCYWEGFTWILLFNDPPNKTIVKCSSNSTADENYWDSEM